MKNSQTLLVIGHTFPEPATTAAGKRMMQLLAVFQEMGYAITFGSTASTSRWSANLNALHINTISLSLNDASFNDFIVALDPSVVLFDRFITEEQFGWRVAEFCPNAIRILDTEDLHFLRKARQESYKNFGNITQVDLYTNTAKREIASIYRCDLSLIISQVEIQLLVETFKVSETILLYLPFMVAISKIQPVTSFEEREGFMTIGNLHHAPNVDSVVFLKKEIWPHIRQQLPTATLSVYGNYAPQHITEYHNEKEGFLIKGWVPDTKTVFLKHKVCLAPLRYGAGLKGKLLDALIYKTPAVTTTIGAEGMYTANNDCAKITDSALQFANYGVSLYTSKTLWNQYSNNCVTVLNTRFNENTFKQQFINCLNNLIKDVKRHRNDNFIGQILQHTSLQATKYMSKWIEAKNKNILGDC